ncbi:MAG: ATP synthase F1 subunit delta [Proteobacteria bacterium]|nr:ATP synthase F1 subunit delta [Pseudomonadota bacterium]
MSTIARRYAGAIVELANVKKCLDPVAEALEAFGAVLRDSTDLQSAMDNPGFSRDELRAVVGSIVERTGTHPIARNFLFLLVDNGRMGAYEDILGAFRASYDKLKGRARAEVTSAAPLDKATLKTLEAHVAKLTGCDDVHLDTHVDPELIGGIVTKVGDLVLDGSIRTQLHGLRTRLLGQVVGEA